MCVYIFLNIVSLRCACACTSCSSIYYYTHQINNKILRDMHQRKKNQTSKQDVKMFYFMNLYLALDSLLCSY